MRAFFSLPITDTQLAYDLATALRGPDTQGSDPHLDDLLEVKYQVTARLRVVAFGLMALNGPAMQYVAVAAPDLAVLRRIIPVLDHYETGWPGWEHFSSHLRIALEHVEIRDHPIWGGHGDEILTILKNQGDAS